jgi:hypothetical protein
MAVCCAKPPYFTSLSGGGGEVTAGYAMSFPDPFTGGEFDSGFFTELDLDPSFINQPNSS